MDRHYYICDMENIQNTEQIILTYTSAWNKTDPEIIREKIDQCWSLTGKYTDKLIDTSTGRDAITYLIVSSYTQMVPRTFHVAAGPVAHHRSGHFRWLAIRPEGYPADGLDYFEFGEHNIITRIVGFF